MPRAALTLALAAAFGLAFQFLFYQQEIGLNAPIAVALLFALGWRLRWSGPRRIDWWMPAFALAFALFLAFRTEMAVVFFNVLAILTLAAAWSASLRGTTVTSLPIGRLLREAWDTITGSVWRALPTIPKAARELPLGAMKRDPLALTAIGMALAIPLVFLFANLFAAADPVFARWWDELIRPADWWERLRDWMDRLLIGLVIGWLVAGAIAWSNSAVPDGQRRPGPLSADIAAGLLGALVVLFAVFVAFQIAFLFTGRDTIAAAGITYADYARRGFFQLLWAAGLTGAVLFVLDLATGRRKRGYTLLALGLIALTGLVLASALYRLSLYQQEYGWSEQRLYAVAAMTALAIGLGILARAVLADRMRFALQPMVFATLAVALVVNAIGPASFVARSNMAASHALDHYYLAELGPAALADVVAGRASLNDHDRYCLDVVLSWRYGWRETPRTPDWQSWNLDRQRAAEAEVALREHVFRDPEIAAAAQGQPTRFIAQCARPRTPESRLIPAD